MKKIIYCVLVIGLLNRCSKDSASPGLNSGIGGSMARFAISGDHLYAVNNQTMKVFNIFSDADPIPAGEVELGFGIETIFPLGNKLFIGSQTGMQIYDNTNQEKPVHLSTYTHVQSCDPVVADEMHAYVTLRAGRDCRNDNINRLDIIDISNLSDPILVNSHDLVNPYGLGVDDTLLFVCDGAEGLKTFNVKDPNNIILLDSIKGISTYDVIPWRQILFVTGPSGFYQYDYSNPNDLQYIGEIKTAK